jgi:DNA adenine methylase
LRYLGGKSKIAKHIREAIIRTTNRRDCLIEPFVGGGSITAVLAPEFKQVKAYDIHLDLILMWQALQTGWRPPIEISENMYVELRESQSSALRGFVGFGGASWGGKWFGGYARGSERNYADESNRSLSRDIINMTNVQFMREDYRFIAPQPGTVVYADPPYVETTGYTDKFDSGEFWELMDFWVSNDMDVFVSEYIAPSGWIPIWSMERTRDMKSKLINAEKVIEKLFVSERQLVNCQ